MAQFNVYPNPNVAAQGTVPFVVDVQSGLIDALPTRLVMPLSRVGVKQARLPLRLCPAHRFRIACSVTFLRTILDTLRRLNDVTCAVHCAMFFT